MFRFFYVNDIMTTDVPSCIAFIIFFEKKCLFHKHISNYEIYWKEKLVYYHNFETIYINHCIYRLHVGIKDSSRRSPREVLLTPCDTWYR